MDLALINVPVGETDFRMSMSHVVGPSSFEVASLRIIVRSLSRTYTLYKLTLVEPIGEDSLTMSRD